MLEINKNIKFIPLIFYVIVIMFCTSVYGITWYSDAIGGNPNDLTKWWSKSNGSGGHPTSFNDVKDIFYLKTGHTYTTINTWNIAGTIQIYGELTIQHANSIKALIIFNKGMVIGNAQTTIADADVGGVFSIYDGGKYIFNHTYINNSLTLFAGNEIFGVNGVIEFQDFEITNGAFSLCLEKSTCNFGTINWNIQSGNTAYNLNYNSNKDKIIAGNFNLIKTGSIGSLTWCNDKEVAKLTVKGNFIQSGGNFYIQRDLVRKDVSKLCVEKDFILKAGIFNMGTSDQFNSTLELCGNLTLFGGKLYRSCENPIKNTSINFIGQTKQIFTCNSGDFRSNNITLNIKNGAILELNNDLLVEDSLVLENGANLFIPDPFSIKGNGTFAMLKRAKLTIGHLDGIHASKSLGAIQTVKRIFDLDIILEYNGVSHQKTGDACKYVSSLIFNNPLGIELSQDITIQNQGNLSLIRGFHDLNGKILTLGSPQEINNLNHVAGGLYSNNNLGVFKRWMPSMIISENNSNNYGFFPFAKSAEQIGFIKFVTSDSIEGGYLSISPLFQNDLEVKCMVKDNEKFIYKVQKSISFKIVEHTLTSNNPIKLEFTCGKLKSPPNDITNLCLTNYSLNGVSCIGTYKSSTGDPQRPKVSRGFTSWNELQPGMLFLLGSRDSLCSLKMQCNLEGVKTVGPTGDFLRLTDALNALAENGLSGNLVFELERKYVSTLEMFPLKINSFFCLGSTNNLIIRPALDAEKLSIGNSVETTIFHLNEADFVTIDGRPGGIGENHQLLIQNAHSFGTTILMSSGATYNSMKYLIIEGAQTNISRGVVEFTSYLGTSNNYDSIINCTIQNSYGKTFSNAIYSKGDGLLKKNEYNYIANNKFINSSSSGIFLDVYNQYWNIFQNHFYQSTAFTPNATVYGIHIVNEGSGYRIENNFIGGQSSNCKGSPYCLKASPNHFFPLYLSVTGVDKPNIIQKNTIQNILLNNTDGSFINPGVFSGIYVSGIPMYNRCLISDNTIGDTVSNSSKEIRILSSVTGALIQGIIVNSNGSIQIKQNLIGNIFTLDSPNKGAVFYGIRSLGSGDFSIVKNKIGSSIYAHNIQIGGNVSEFGKCVFYGIHNVNLGEQSIIDNEIVNCSVFGLGASQFYGIYTMSSMSTLKITKNIISHLGNMAQKGESQEALSIGIYQNGGCNNTIDFNKVEGLEINNGFFKGIYIANTSGITTLSENSIGGLKNGINIKSKAKCFSFDQNVVNNHCGILINANCTNIKLNSNKIVNIICRSEIDNVIGGVVIEKGTKSKIDMTANSIDKIESLNAGEFSSDVIGVYFGNYSIFSNTIKQNKIRRLCNINSKMASISGLILLASNQRIINNFISLQNSDDDTCFYNSVSMYGIDCRNTVNTNSPKFYYNTINIGGESKYGNQNTFALKQEILGSSDTFLLVNNILQNARFGDDGLHYPYFANIKILETLVLKNNYFVGLNEKNYAFINQNLSSIVFENLVNSNNNKFCQVSSTPCFFNLEGATTELSKFIPAADLSIELDCLEDINGYTNERSAGVLSNHIGCYEGPIHVYYSISETDILATDDVKNWNSKKDASGIHPIDFNQDDSQYIIQRSHKYMLESNWSGNKTSAIIIDSGGVLDLNANILSNWKSLQLSGNGIENSGVLLNLSNSKSVCKVPIVLKTNAIINTIGKGNIQFTGGFSIDKFQLIFDGDSSIIVQDSPIEGTGGICKRGYGNLYLTNQNLFTGNACIQEGKVYALHSESFGANVGRVEINSHAMVLLQNNINIKDSLWIQGNTNFENEMLLNQSGENTWSGPIFLGKDNVIIHVLQGSLNLSGTVSNNSTNIIFDVDGLCICSKIDGTGNVIKDGKGVLILNNTNKYLGNTKLIDGRLELNAPQLFMQGDVELIGGVFKANGHEIKIKGNWINKGAIFVSDKNRVTMYGQNKSITSGVNNIFYELKIDAPVHLGSKTLIKNKLILDDCLTLEKFDLELDTFAVIEGCSKTSFVVTNDNGKLTRQNIGCFSSAEATIYPIGYSSNPLDYTPCSIFNKGRPSDISVRMGKERLENGYVGNPKLDHGVDRTWFLSANKDGFIADITLQWTNAREQMNFSRLNCNIGHYNGSSWDYGSEDLVAKSMGEYTYSMTRSNLVSFSPFVVEDVTALPIRLVDFKATLQSKKVKLEWQTASEYRNDLFQVERSIDGKIFEYLFTKKGNYDSKSRLWYSGLDDNPKKGVNYYRLKQIDVDGEFTYSEIVSVAINHDEEELISMVFPNPILENILKLNYFVDDICSIQVAVYNLAGDLVHSNNLSLQKGENLIKEVVNFNAKGIYLLKIGNEHIGFKMLKFSKE